MNIFTMYVFVQLNVCFGFELGIRIVYVKFGYFVCCMLIEVPNLHVLILAASLYRFNEYFNLCNCIDAYIYAQDPF